MITTTYTYEPQRTVANETGATIAAGIFVKIATGGLRDVPRVAVCGAGELAYGITLEEILDDAVGPVAITGNYAMTAGAILATGDVVKSDATGNPVPAAIAATERLGICTFGGAAAATVMIEFDRLGKF